MSGADVAVYCGVTLATLSKWVTDGRLPPPLPGTRRWDRKAIDLALDKLSGIQAPLSPEDEAEKAWEEWHAEYRAKLTAAVTEPVRLKKDGTPAKKPGPRPLPRDR
ncbi:helix-turn-helix transcriptional regulator [Bradyrhizobium sp. 1200_D9_N1_1]|uniref:helix-turn-helix transcriptional regulator n=1 Tax=Bradyrhizobium sp. 1200_D9_N1_1 TaxID=3239013 RepID=UPI003F8AE6E0